MRWAPMTALFVVASAWWVKWPLFVAIGACGDARAATASRRSALGARCCVRRRDPDEPVQGSVRPRSARLGESGIEALVATPESASFPSGHTSTAFAAAIAVGGLLPSPALAAHRSGIAGRAFANLPRSPLRAGRSRRSSAGDRARSPGRVGDSSPPRIARPIRYESASGRNELDSEPYTAGIGTQRTARPSRSAFLRWRVSAS